MKQTAATIFEAGVADANAIALADRSAFADTFLDAQACLTIQAADQFHIRKALKFRRWADGDGVLLDDRQTRFYDFLIRDIVEELRAEYGGFVSVTDRRRLRLRPHIR
ncbi:MAG: hypothetical protein AAFQ44_06420 [Pseudomonadota bacterium]